MIVYWLVEATWLGGARWQSILGETLRHSSTTSIRREELQFRGESDLDPTVDDAHITARHLKGWVTDAPSGHDDEFPAVPGTFNVGAADFAFTEWTTRVWTGIIDRIKRPV